MPPPRSGCRSARSRSCPRVQRGPGAVGRRDHRRPAALADEAHRRPHLRAHAAVRELAVLEVLRGLLDGHLVDGAPVGRVEVDVDLGGVGDQHEGVGVHRGRESLGGEVLVDHGVDPLESPVAGDDGDAAPARGDDDHVLVDEGADGVDLDDADRPRRGHDAAVAALAVVDHVPPAGPGELSRLVLGEVGADGLGRVLEGRIGGVDHDVGDDRDHSGQPPAALGEQGEAEQAPELALGHRVDAEERERGDDGGGLVLLDGEVPDLGAVAVDEDDVPAGIAQRAHGAGHGPRVLGLLSVRTGLAAPGDGVPAEGDHCGLGHGCGSLPWSGDGTGSSMMSTARPL